MAAMARDEKLEVVSHCRSERRGSRLTAWLLLNWVGNVRPLKSCTGKRWTVWIGAEKMCLKCCDEEVKASQATILCLLQRVARLVCEV